MLEKCKNNKNQYCHAELGSASIKHLNPPVISRLTGNPGNKDFNASWMPDRVGHDNGVVSQSGRSMVEMLGTLAIVGVLSAGAIGGYSYAMNKHRTNELIYEATKRAQWVGTQLEMNNPNPSLNTFGTDSFGGGTFTGEVVQLENGQIGIKVAGLKEAVCQNILNSIGDNTVIREMRDVNCNDDNGTATLVFNRDLSPSDPTEIPEASGEASGPASTASEVTATEASDRKLHCNDHGDWDGSSCDCDAGYEGETCSVEINAQPDEPEETATTQRGDAECSYHGRWCGSFCNCNSGWGGSDCSQDSRAACNNHGTWDGWGCVCDPGYGGRDASGKADCSMTEAEFCNGRGTLNADPACCSCVSGWYGARCSFSDARSACSNHGSWWDCGCNCESGYGGSDCSVNGRETYCSNHGTWNGSSCSCESGYTGPDCAQLDHPCNGHGTWIIASGFPNGLCSCDSGWYGSNCTSQDPCSEHGHWCGSFCRCDSGWDGSDCSVDTTCNGHGHWCGSFCRCDSGWDGGDCSIRQ